MSQDNPEKDKENSQEKVENGALEKTERMTLFLQENKLFLCILFLALALRLLYMSPGIRFNGTDLSLQAYNFITGQYDQRFRKLDK